MIERVSSESGCAKLFEKEKASLEALVREWSEYQDSDDESEEEKEDEENYMLK